MGNYDQAVAHFEDALAFCRKGGYRPELAWSCRDYADTLLQRNEPGDREQAVSLLDESLAISSELGMRPLMERVLSIESKIFSELRERAKIVPETAQRDKKTLVHMW